MADTKWRLSFRKLLRIASWIIAGAILLITSIILLVRLPAIQNRLTQKVISYLEKKIGTEVRLKSIYISFPKKITIEGLYLEDQSNDTLLFFDKLSIDTDLWGLTKNRIELNDIKLNNARVFVHRSGKDSTFNFGYILTAFADSTVTKSEDSAEWTFTIEDITLSNVSFLYNDEYLGTDLETKLGDVSIQMEEFDPQKAVYKAKSIDSENSQFTLVQRNGVASNNETTRDNALAYEIDFSNISLNNIKFKYVNVSTQQRVDITLGQLEVVAKQIDLAHHFVDLDKIKLEESFVSYSEYGESPNAAKIQSNRPVTLTSLLSGWNFTLRSLQLADNGFQYYDFSKPVINKVFDDAHIWLRNLRINATDLKGSQDEIKTTITGLSFNEQHGFVLRSLEGELKLTNTELEVSQLKLKTQNSIFDAQAHIKFNSLDALVKHFERTNFALDVKNTSISANDVLYFAPHLLDSVPLHLTNQTSVTLNAKLSGRLNNLAISQFHLKTLDSTSIALNGSIKGLPDIQHAIVNAVVENFYTIKTDIDTILPDSTIPNSIQIPKWIQLTGKMTGSFKAPEIRALVTSDAGHLDATYKTISPTHSSYNATIVATHFNVGQILKQKEMGRIDLKASVNGSGFTMDSLDAAFDVAVENFEYKNYDYHDFKLNGNLKKYFFTGYAILKDKNLDFELNGDMDYQNEIPHYKFTLKLQNADFKELHLSERALNARATFDIDLATSDFKIINGTMNIRNVAIYNGEALYNVDSLLFASIDQQGESELSIRSDILTGDFKGMFNVFQMPKVLKQHINQYFTLQDKSITAVTEPQNFSFNLTILNTDLLTEIIFPDLISFVPGKIHGEFDSEENILELGIEITKLKYATTSLDSFVLNVSSDQNKLDYSVKFNELSVDTLRIAALRLEGKIASDSITTKLLILDSLKENKYVVGGTIKSVESNFQYSLIPDQIILNYNKWKSPPNNYLRIGVNGIVANDFSLSREGEKFSIITSPKDSTVSLEFQKWRLSTLTRVVEGVVPANGEINGNIKFTTARKGEFNSTLQINQLAILEKEWGDAALSIAHKANLYTIALNVRGKNVDVSGTGHFSPAPISTYEMDLSLEPFDLSLIEPISLNQLKKATGSVTGKIKLSGTSLKSSIRGKLTFRDASLFSTYLNTEFLLKDESISFEERGIEFNNFKIVDQNNNEALIKGLILTKDYSNYDLDLRITTRNFQILNTQESDNTLYFGNLKINAKADITGNTNQPRIDASLSIGNGSEITYVVPAEEKSALEQKGIVRFINKNAASDPFLKNILFEDTTQTMFRGLDVNATIELTDKSILNIVVDPDTGDRLSLKGSSTLVFNSEASGDLNLAGRYEITSGTYDFSFYKLVKREFDIVKGSSITWSGDPLNASMDLRALYKVETSPLDLVYNQINTANQDEVNSYNQRLPFLVFLNIKGVLLVPQISFTLDMPDDKRNVFGGAIYSKLQDINTRESDLNKQVFALLILRRFISDNPLESQAGSSISNTTRISVSRMLSEQLNRLSQNIKGIELDFDIKSYENNLGNEAQGQTKLQLGISKNLFKDRLVVKLAGNIDIEGAEATQKDVTDYIGDLALEYKLTPDGRFRVTGFRNSNYDMIDGELVETGAGLIYIKDYNTLRELLKPNATAN